MSSAKPTGPKSYTAPTTLAPQAALRRLRRLLGSALALIALVSLLALGVIWSRFASAPLHAQTINLVGRQRMLAMRVIENVTHLADEPNDAESREELKESLRKLVEVNTQLTSPTGDAARSREMRAHLERAAGPLAVLEGVGHLAVTHSARGHSPDVREIGRLRQAGRSWIAEMDGLNARLVTVRAERDSLYTRVPLALGVLVLATLVLAWRGLHAPAMKLMTETLRELDQERGQRERLALVARNTTNAIMIADAAQRVEWTNDAFTRLTGYSLAELQLVWSPQLLQGQETDPRVFTRMQESASQGHGFKEQVAIYAKDGSRHWVMVDGQPLYDRGGRPSGFVAVMSEMTALLEMERILTKQAERYDVAMTAAEMGVWDWDIKTGKLEYDDHQFALFGLDVKTLKPEDRDWRKYVLPEDLAIPEASLARALKGMGNYSAQFRIRRGDGEIRWLHGTGIVIRDPSGKPARMVGVNVDITSRHSAEEERRELDLRLRKLTENLPGVLFQLRMADGIPSVPYVSSGLQQLLGFTPEELQHNARQLFGRIDPDDAPRVQSAIVESARSLGTFNQDFRITAANGDTLWLRVHATPTREEDGATIWFGVMLDSSTIKEAELREREATAQLEAAQELVQLGSWSLDIETRRIVWSRQMYALYGRDPALGPPAYSPGAPSTIYVEEDGIWLHEQIRAAVEHGEPFSGFLRVRKSREGIAVLRADAKVTVNAEGKTTRIYGTVIDITASVERERALSRAQVAAEAASRAKSEFLANMSHEIRTPMAAILGYVDLLADPELPRSQLQEFVTTIQRNAKHLLELINQVLDLSKIEAGEMTVERIACSPAAIAREIVSLMRPRASEKNLNLSLKFEGALPITIESDPTRLRQILLNLLGNAIKFTTQGSVELTIGLERAAVPVPQLRMQVKDTGIGIEADQLEHLFRPFSQADSSTTRRFGGTGLGLSIADRLARMLGGHIAVVSTPGVGTTFTVTVATGDLTGVELREPRHEIDDLLLSAAPPRPAHEKRPLAGHRILLVEDGSDNQRLISLHLTRAGAMVEVLGNGELAIKRLTSSAMPPCDTVLMDMQMPVLDGYAATAKLRSMGYGGPIIALTAHAMEGDRQKCLQAGCDEYTTKPVDYERIVSLILGLTRKSPPRAIELTTALPQPPPANTQQRAASQSMSTIVSTFQDDPEMAELVEMFVGSLPERANELADAHAGHDLAKLGRLAHQIKGAGGGYGFPQITEAAEKLERAIDTKQSHQDIKIPLDELVALCRSARYAPGQTAAETSGPKTAAGAAVPWPARS
ncbi:MAG: PAS domain-containing protein [Polyangiales bacterium]